MAANTSQILVVNYATTAITTSAYTQLVLATPISVSKIQISDSSTYIVKLAIGAAGSEVDICTNAISATTIVPIYIPVGTRLSVKSVNQTSISSGYLTVSLVQ